MLLLNTNTVKADFDRDDWIYYKEITVSNKIDNYQTKIIVGNQTDVGDVNCSGFANSDFSDLRFACANDTLVPYWVENYTTDVQATVWIKNEYNDSVLYMYYGNDSATTVSDGNSTFIFFDDFEGTSLNACWDTSGVNINWQVANSIMYMNSTGDPGSPGAKLTLNNSYNASTPYGSRTYSKLLCKRDVNDWATMPQMKVYTTDISDTDYGHIMYRVEDTDDLKAWSSLSGVTGGDDGGISTDDWTDDVWRYFTIETFPEDQYIGFYVWYANRTQWGNKVIRTNTSFGSANFSNINVEYYMRPYSASYYVWVDYVCVMNFTNETEPTFEYGVQELVDWNSDPVITAASENPPNTQVDVELSLANYYNHFNISVTDVNDANQTMNITWRTNASTGIWHDFNESLNKDNGTYYAWNVSWVNSFNTKYWWSVNVSDGCGGWDNETFNFTVEAEPGVSWLDYSFGSSVDVTSHGATWSTYSFGAAVNIYGWSDWSCWWNITQLQFTAPTSLSVSTYSSSALNISWTPGNYNDATVIVRKKNSMPAGLLDGDIVFNNTGSYYNDTSLDTGTNYSYKAWGWNDTFGFTSANVSDYAFTKPGTPSSLTNTSRGASWVNFSWTNGTNATRYVMRYSDFGYPATPQSNSSGFNITGADYGQVTGLTANSTYYFRMWSYVNPFSEGNVSMLATTLDFELDPPYNGSSDYIPSGNYLNLSWERGNFSDSDIVVRKSTGYPSGPGDGTVVDNNTGNVTGGRYYYNESGVVSFAYYKVYSYNATNNTYSGTGLEIPWGAMVIWDVFNESNMSQAINFDIEITDKNATQVYTETNVSGPLYLDINDIPYGDDTIFLISNSSYKQRIYYYDLELNYFYNFTFYLPPHTTPVDPGTGDNGGNTTDTQLYLLIVVGPQEEYTSPPVEGATINIRRYNNVTDSYVNITTVLTDANGQVEVYLVPFTLYKVTVSKEGYDTTISEYIPGTDIFTKTFRIVPSTTVPPEYDIFWDDITFNCTMYLNASIRVYYSDANSSTINTTIQLYDVFNGSFSLTDWHNSTNQTYFYWVSGINTSHNYQAWLWFNNTATYASVTSPVVINILPVNQSWGEPFDLDERFTNVFGNFVLGYGNTIAIILPVCFLLLLGPFNVGAGVMAAGFSLSLVQALYGLFVLGAFNPLLAIVGPIAIVLGYMYMHNEGEDHL